MLRWVVCVVAEEANGEAAVLEKSVCSREGNGLKIDGALFRGLGSAISTDYKKRDGQWRASECGTVKNGE
jgi:hypothetical protein